MKQLHFLLLLFVGIFSFNFSYAQGENFSQRTVKCAMAQPWELTYGADNHLWVTEARSYKLQRINPTTGASTVILDANNQRNFGYNQYPAPQGGFTGLALHPQLLTGKPYIYLAFVHQLNGCALPSGNCDFRTKVVRYDYNAATLTVSNPVTLVDTIPGSDDHNGGRLTIGNVSGVPYLFYSVGDMGAGQFANANRAHKAQDVSSYEGKILRFNLEPDGDVAAFDKWIPASNLYNTASKQSAVWSLGHRNPQGLVFSPNGTLYEAEHGPYSDDELNIIQPGKNYGFPLIAGLADGNYNGIKVGTGPTVPLVNEQASATSLGSNYANPIKSFFPVPLATTQSIYNNQVAGTDPYPNYFLSWPSIAPAGIDFYGSSAIPGWSNSILVASLKRGTIYRLKLSADGNTVASDTIPYFKGQGRFRDLAISPDGTKIYVACDSLGNLSGPTQGTSAVPLNRGCILEFTYNAPNVSCMNNLLLNPSFESQLTAWSGGELTNVAQSGAVAVRLGTNGTSVKQTRNAIPNKAYSFTAWAKNDAGNTGYFRIKYMNSSYISLGQEIINFNAAGYTAYTRTSTSPAGTAFVEIGFFKSSGTGFVYADNFCFDAGGTIGTCSPDVTKPTLTACPSNISLTTSTATATATWTAPTATDNCAGTVAITSTHTSDTSFPIGSTTVTYTAKDAANNTATCSFTVTVTSQGTNTCVGNLLLNPGFESSMTNWSAGGELTSVAHSGNLALRIGTNGARVRQSVAATAGKTYTLKLWGKRDAGVTGSVRIRFSNSSFTSILEQFIDINTTNFTEFTKTVLAPATTAFVEISATKSTGTSTSYVSVDDFCLTDGGTTNPCAPDVTAPTLTACPGNISLTTSTASATATWTAPTAIDNCVGTVAITSTHNSGSNFPIGSTTVTYTARDASNNTTPCSFTVTVTAQGNNTCEGNLVLNPGFESGLNSWSGGGEISTTTHSGTNALRIATAGTRVRQSVPATAGKTYSLRVWGRFDTPIPCSVRMRFSTSAFSPLMEHAIDLTTSAYAESTITLTAPANTGWVEISVIKWSGTGSLFVDDFCLKEVNQNLQSIEAAPINSGTDVSEYSLYPNPASELLHLRLPLSTTPVQLQFINQLGKTEKVITIEKVDNEQVDIDLSGLNNGMYFLQIVEQGKRPVLKKVVIAKDY